MLPRRSARMRTRIHEQDAEPVKQDAEPVRPGTLPSHALNTKGLPLVPTEVLLEILSNMQTMPIPCIRDPISAQYKERSMTLYALSQTCRSLRSALLPFVWERIEVCTANGWSDLKQSPRWSKNIATDLVEQLEVVTVREPSFASFVKTVTVVISGHSVDKVLREFARCLALMPNLHTIQIIDMLNYSLGRSWSYLIRYPAVETIFEKAFKVHTFPSVQRVVLSPRAHMLFRCFPNARKVYLNPTLEPRRNFYTLDYDDFKQSLSRMAKHCRNVEEIDCFDELKQNSMELVVSAFPKLRSVRVHGHCIDMAFISQLYKLKNLERIELVASGWTQQFQEKRMEAIRVLEKSPVDDEKKVLVITGAKTGGKVEIVKFTM